jgi:16S rRNA (uracil1498-N3)-methyltransferase
MDLYRFYVPNLLAQLEKTAGEGEVQLPDDQGHHARAVLRLEGGEKVVIFDGKGAWVAGEVDVVDRRRPVGVRVAGAVEREVLPRVRLTLATAVPKGERAEWLVEQASQLNVSRLRWLKCDRSVVKPREGGQKLEKWRRLAVESAKQCGRAHVMEVAEPAGLAEVLEAHGNGTVIWLDPRGAQGMGGVLDSAGERGDARIDVLALVGPEGGWSEREEAMLTAGADAGRIRRVRLTATVLRIETACAAIAAVVMSAV